MDTDTATATATSSSCITAEQHHQQQKAAQLPQVLEISVISAQDVAPVSKSMHTYAVVWVTPNRKYTTKTDPHGHKNPTWNDRFVFRDIPMTQDEENATVNVEIYANTWFRDVLVGTVKVRIADLISPLLHDVKSTRFVALQVRRPSGCPQGILNMGVALLDSSVKRVSSRRRQQLTDDEEIMLNHKTHLYRSLSARSSNNDTDSYSHAGKAESAVNGENGSELNSDIGPSASVVAAELAHKQHLKLQQQKMAKKGGESDTESSILDDLTAEEARAKGYRIEIRKERRRRSRRQEADSDDSDLSMIKHPRRNSDTGLCSCFVCGVEFAVVCGGSRSSRRKKAAETS